MFHVQTEDSGVAAPHIVTLLYRGGVILASKKTSYADILKIENLDTVVEELMKDQHKAMMRRLKAGEFDQRAFQTSPSAKESGKVKPLAENVAGSFSTPLASQSPPSAKSDISLLFAMPVQRQDSAAGQQPAGRGNTVKDVVGLDDAIRSFFGTYDK
ncbi:MAG: hypothetical protein P4L44_00655 [Oryzomonas sp.]|uniref:hypothetical protein n=1 Tax=Oryzomonas sp. TaxID=2855186 RepID=UPI002850A2ED|nr:hypothetical protein [Oryzomonas sp.]MDR3578454.1 hypothetical protein [Oryzomonas sp.]